MDCNNLFAQTTYMAKTMNWNNGGLKIIFIIIHDYFINYQIGWLDLGFFDPEEDLFLQPAQCGHKQRYTQQHTDINNT